MISSFRNFAKTKFAGLLVFIMIIPFVFWGMGGMFSSGNTNNIAKVNEKNISTEEFIDYLNNSGVPQEYIRENLDKEIIQELLAGLISSTLLDLEIEKLNISISKDTLLKQIKTNKNFLDENGNFQRIKYEKFLLENNQSAAGFELRLKKREEQKNLFDYIGAGTISPKFLSKKLYIEENKKLEIEFLNLKNLYAKKEDITDIEINEFIKENNDQLKVEYIDFNYVVLNPKNLIGTDDFNQTFFDKIDEIDIDISNEIDFKSIISNLDIEPISVKNFKFSVDKNEIEKKIFELRKNKIDLFENENDYILYEIQNIDQREADINDQEIKSEIVDILVQKSKFDYNQQLLERINNKEFNRSEFSKIGKDSIQKIELNSIRDNKKFEINSVRLLYSLPINSFTLINDEENDIYLAMIKNFRNENIDTSNDNFNEFINKQNSNNKKSILKSYDMLLSDKYNITLNQKTIERVKNYFQ